MTKNIRDFKNFVPETLLEKLRYWHYKLVSKWIINFHSQNLEISQKSTIVFSPHQDDETFGCGGMISLKCQQQASVVVVFLTDGHKCGSYQDISQSEIIALREQEALKALQIIGVETSNIHFLRKPDCELKNLSENEREKTIDQIMELIKTHKPEEVYVPHCQEVHPDHHATYELVHTALNRLYTQAQITAELIQYPIWLFWSSPLFIQLSWQDIAAAQRLEISAVQDKKRQAIAAYKSQFECLPHNFINLFFGKHEIFFKTKL
jgi:N-acetylglucosamine malate deacetylase 1